MKNLIKAQLYQISKTKVYRWVFIFFVGLSVLFGSVEYLNGANMLEDGQLLTASDYATRMGMMPTMAIWCIAFFTGFICTDDFGDKTCNYEVMSGRMRRQAYLARAIVAVAVSVIVSELLVIVSLGTATILTGWGDSITVGTAALRAALLCFPYIRLSCLFVLLSYIIKKPAALLVVAYAMPAAIMMITENSPNTMTVLTSVTNIAMLTHYDMWYTFGLDSGAHYVYEPVLGAGNIFLTIAASLVAAAAYLAVGYSYFHGDDLE